ncbi:ABC transporter substrate-binding protein [Paenibacillus ginsengihumi]|uniref:ABC transporter substrate-binding protein n=1 Tax=Paenibacillus ginsengihumi TaxID=431596 RepID=UPI000361CD7F|nr:sugar ABC transporter substrate-binding protein [Paenibacillus ginsengihumi]
MTRLGKIIGLAAAFAAALTAAGCGGGEQAAEADPSKPYAGEKLMVFALNHQWADTIKGRLPEFEQKSGIKVDLQTFAEEQLQQKLAVQLTSNSETPDLFMYRPYMDKILYAKNGWTEPLDEYAKQNADYDFADFAASSIEASSIDGKLMSIPLFTDQFVLYYRKDVLQKHQLAVPKTLEEMQAAVKTVHDPANELYGFVARGQRNALVTALSSFIFSEGGDFMKGDRATLNTPETISGIRIYADLLKNYGPPGTLNMSWPQAAGLFAQGKAAFYVETASIYKNTTDPEKSLVKDHVGFATFPAGSAGPKPASITAWSLAMNPKAKNKDAAWAFVAWASSKENVLKIQQSGVPGPRSSVWASKEGTANFPADLAATIQETMKIGVGYNVPQVISVGEARDAVGSIAVKAMLGEDIQAAAEQANAELQDIIDKDKMK